MTARYEDRIVRVLTYIHDNPAGDLSLDTLADVAAMSRFHWHRVFRAITGETCAQAVRRMRLHRAATALVQSEASLAQIAAQTGYPNPGSFSRAFTEAYGTSPAAFRKAGRLMPAFPKLKIGDHPMHPVDIRTLPKRRLAVLRHSGAYHEIGRSFEAFGAMAETRGLWPKLGPAIALYLDNPEAVPEEALRSFAGSEFHGGAVPDGMEELQIDGGKTAVLTYKGPYSGIPAAYDELYGSWLPGSGEEPADLPGYEIYLNDPRSTAPDELVTEICMPLK